MSDQELDNLFREASSKYEVPYDDKEWEKMEALLDKPHSVRTPFWNWKKFGIAALLITMSSALLLIPWNGTPTKQEGIATDALNMDTIRSEEKLEQMIVEDRTMDNTKKGNPSSRDLPSTGGVLQEKADIKNNPPSAIEKKTIALQKVNQQKQISQGNEDDKTIINPEDNRKNTGSELDNERGSTVGNRITKVNDRAPRNTAQPVKTTRDRIKDEQSDSPEKNSQTNEKVKSLTDAQPELPASSLESVGVSTPGIKKKDKVVPTAAVYKLLSADKKLLESEANNNSTAKRDDMPYDAAVKDSARIVATQVEAKDSVVNHDPATKREDKKDTLDKIQHFSIRLALSPDFSSVGYFKPGKTGFNYGLLAEYNITRHWSVTTGAIWSKKIYSNLKTENSGYGTVSSTQLKGSCRVLDLPLNINYYFTPQNTFSVYTSVGLSSYLMFDEDYTYDYVNGSKTYSYAKKTAKGNTEWFRMMNISIGIQQRLSPQMRLQLEPFVKAPLSGIGGGDLKLVSSGVFVNFKYTFK